MAGVPAAAKGLLVPLLYSLHLLLLMHELLLDFGHMVIVFHHFCIVVWWPLPRCAGGLKLAYRFLCCS